MSTVSSKLGREAHDPNLPAVGGDHGMLADRSPGAQRVKQPLIRASVLSIGGDVGTHDAVCASIHTHPICREKAVPKVVRADIVSREL